MLSKVYRLPKSSKILSLYNLNDFHSYQKIVDLMKETEDEQERREAAYIVFLKAYYNGNMLDGKSALEYLLLSSPKESSMLKEKEIKDTYMNLMVNGAFYMTPIYSTILHNLKQRSFKNLDTLNPFIINDVHTGDYVVGTRCMNLRSNKGSDYDIFIFKDGKLTQNFPLIYQFNYQKQKRLNSSYGVEDVRVISFKNQWIGVGTTMDTHSEPIRMSLFYIDTERNKNGSIVKITARDLVPLHGYQDEKKQKNWLPFVSDDKLHFIYKSDPITILQAEENEGKITGKVSKIYEDTIIMAPKQRGSTPPIPYGDKWLYISHCAESRHRVYYHRFIEMDKEFNMTRVSIMFYFERNNSIEFAIGLVPTQENEQEEFLISYGVEDKTARVSKVKKTTIEEMFDQKEKLISFKD